MIRSTELAMLGCCFTSLVISSGCTGDELANDTSNQADMFEAVKDHDGALDHDTSSPTDMRADAPDMHERAPDMKPTAPDMKLPDFAPIELPAGAPVNRDHLATADACSSCHSAATSANAMRDDEGDSVGFYELWEASMMANAARDPFWRAMVAAEVNATPSIGAAIEDKCLTCHAPLYRSSTPGSARASELLEPSELASLGLDGVTCTTCHQIKPDNLGTPDSFDGHYELALDGDLFGPYSDPFANPMVMHSGFAPVEGQHMLESELCATCHTLTTDTYTPDGTKTGHALVEQSPYLEWQNSRFAGGDDERSCQSCHVPRQTDQGADLVTKIARKPNQTDFNQIQPRALGRHLFVGGNTLVPQMLRDHREQLQPRASATAFEALIEQTTRQLTQATASISIESINTSQGSLQVKLLVTTQVGHKFPSGFPSRRAWIKLTVTDAEGRTFFASGDYDSHGVILNGEQPHPVELVSGPVEPHHDLITNAAQVQIYEAVMETPSGEPAWRLLRGARYKKDNRLLPQGWSAVFEGVERITPVGPVEANFAGGQDHITYQIEVPPGTAPASISAELLYQPLSTRFARELFAAGEGLDEVMTFEQYWRQADKRPVIISAHRQDVPAE